MDQLVGFLPCSAYKDDPKDLDGLSSLEVSGHLTQVHSLVRDSFGSRFRDDTAKGKSQVLLIRLTVRLFNLIGAEEFTDATETKANDPNSGP